MENLLGFKVELSYEDGEGDMWYCETTVAATSKEEAGKKAIAISSSLEFYQVIYGPPVEKVKVDFVYKYDP